MSLTEAVRSLIEDDDCRVCYHKHPDGPCQENDLLPGPDGEETVPCMCDDYVDLEAESRIVVKVRP